MLEQYHSRSTEETEQLGQQLALRLQPGAAVALAGGLGAGKTAFVRGLARGLACEDHVCSPTYALVHVYAGAQPLAHFDMYRVDGWESLESTGYFDYLDGVHILAVEWSEKIRAALPENAWHVNISAGKNENERIIEITAP